MGDSLWLAAVKLTGSLVPEASPGVTVPVRVTDPLVPTSPEPEPVQYASATTAIVTAATAPRTETDRFLLRLDIDVLPYE
jgi:hypothetical protein